MWSLLEIFGIDVVRRVKVAVGGLASLLQRVGRGVGRQRLHIFSGRQELRMLQSLAANVPWVQRACSQAAWVVVDTIWMVVFSARATLYGGQEPTTTTIFLGGCSPQRAKAGSGGGAAGYEWGGQWQTTVSRHARRRMQTCCGLRSGSSVSNQPSTMLSFLGLQLDMAGSSAATSGSYSTLRRVAWAGDAFEAHKPQLRARDHVAVRQSLVAGSTGDTLFRGPGQANVWRAAASWLRADIRAYGCRNRVRELQTRMRPSTEGVTRGVTPPLVRAEWREAVGQRPASQAELEFPRQESLFF
jgi:hypothetical protein